MRCTVFKEREEVPTGVKGLQNRRIVIGVVLEQGETLALNEFAVNGSRYLKTRRDGRYCGLLMSSNDDDDQVGDIRVNMGW